MFCVFSPDSRLAHSQQIQVSKFIPEDEKRFYVQNIMCASWSNATEMMKEVLDAEHLYQDQQPSYANKSANILGCAHYERSCKQKCPICQRFFACHKCHDEQVKAHPMDRFQVSTLMCMKCGVEQPVSAHCTSPQCAGAAPFAKNHCLKCRVYTSRNVFHCPGCDVCRLGSADDYVHCDKCCVCLEKSTFAMHKCVEDSHKASCPICRESMSSRECNGTVVVTICGHPLHEECLNEYVGHGNFKCPVCMHVLGDMSIQFAQLSRIIAEQPMPPEYRATTATVQCVCCNHVGQVPFHFVGHQCSKCGSFNTSILATHNMPDQTAMLSSVPMDEADEEVDNDSCMMSIDTEEEQSYGEQDDDDDE